MIAVGSELEPDDRAWLLAHARDAIREHLGRVARTRMPAPAGARRPSGAFVTLHLSGELRGCVGTLEHDRSLDEAVASMAIAAGFHDPRFPPLETGEVDDLDIEISVLGPLLAARPEDVVPGLHGVAVSSEGRRAVYLPSVATEEGWDRERLLEETCLKAGLEANCWRAPSTRISIFTAEVFGDRREDV